MADRPWVTPAELIEFTEYPSVKNRSEARLRTDIARAELYVINYCNNDFKGISDEHMGDVKIAVMLIAEAYAFNAALHAEAYKGESNGGVASGRVLSASFDDYSYTRASITDETISIEGLDIVALLDPFIINKPNQAVTMKLRKL